MRFRLTHLLIATLLIALAVFCLREAVYLHEYGVEEAYAKQSAVRLVIQYLKDNDQQWPSGWNDLQESYLQAFEGDDKKQFENIRKNVVIDFDVHTRSLWREVHAHDHPVFEVIWGRRRTAVDLGQGPNWEIYNYLRSIDHPSDSGKKELPLSIPSTNHDLVSELR